MSRPELKPAWLNENFFAKIFQDELRIQNKDFRVLIKSFEPISGHVGSLLRVKVDLIKIDNDETAEYSLIIKYLRDSTNDEAFTREIAMYEEILPALEYEWKVRNENITFAPKLYRTSSDPVKLLVIEEVITKTPQELDLNYSKMFLEKLAKYHATTAVYFDKYMTYGEAFDVNFAQHKQEFEANWSRLCPKFAELFENYDSLKPYSTKIAIWKDSVGGELYDRALKINKSALNVLIHGDCKTNNLLFLHNEVNEVTDVLFIDFEESVFNSPIYDLLQFLVISTTNNVVGSGQIDDLIEFYHTNLISYLKKLNYRMHVPNLDEFNMEIRQRSFWGCYVIASSLELSLFQTGQLAESTVQRLEIVFKWFDRSRMLDI